jgi:hypothetical protein
MIVLVMSLSRIMIAGSRPRFSKIKTKIPLDAYVAGLRFI